MTRPDRRYLRLAAKSFGKELIWHLFCQHEQGSEPNILLFATRRGGSTFLMEVIAANCGVRSLDQPYEMSSLFPSAAQVADMPLFDDGQLTSLDDRSERRLRSLTERLFAGQAVINAPTRLWRHDVERRSNRLVLKILDAKPLIGWFAATFPCDVVYLTRHPIPQALSCIRNGWTTTSASYLRDERFVAQHLSADAIALARDTMRDGSPLEQFVLNWALENVAPMRLLPSHPEWLHVRYEDCILDPVGVLETVASRLRLADRELMEATLRRPSVSSSRSTGATRHLIEQGAAARTAASWRNAVDPVEEAWCNRLLETFDIDPGLLLPAT